MHGTVLYNILSFTNIHVIFLFTYLQFCNLLVYSTYVYNIKQNNA